MTAKKCKLSTSTSTSNHQILKKNMEESVLKKIVVLASESFTYYVFNEYVPRVRAIADQCLQHHQGCPETPKSADVICERLSRQM